MKCPHCNGSGKVQLLTSARDCATCGGNGEVIADADMQTVLAAEKVNGGAWHGPTFAVDNTTVHHGGFHHFDAPGSIGIMSADECREAARHQPCSLDVAMVLGTEVPRALFNEAFDGYADLKEIDTMDKAEAFRVKWLGTSGKFRTWLLSDRFAHQRDLIANWRKEVAEMWEKISDRVRLKGCAPHRQPIDVTGKPTPPEIIKGVYGKTHFDVNNAPRGTRVFLNGTEVKYAVEADTEGGWVRVHDRLFDKPIVIGDCVKESILFGKVEMVTPIPHSGDLLYKSAKLPCLNEETWAALGLPPKDQIHCESITVDPIPGTMQAQVTVAYRFR